MFLTDLEIRQRFGAKRPGLELIAIEDAAIPVTVIGAQVLAQEEKGMPLLDEFVLRSAAQGMTKTNDVASLLGVDALMLDATVAGQYTAGNLDYDPSTATFRLTPRGEVAARDLTLATPVEQEIPVIFDRAIWRVGDYREHDLINKRDAETSGMIFLPALNTRRVTTVDVRSRDVEDLLDAGRTGRAKGLQILEVTRVRVSKYQYLPVKLLAFSNGSEDAPELMVLVDGDDSAMHENHLESLGGAKKLGMRIERATATLQTLDVPEVAELEAEVREFSATSIQVVESEVPGLLVSENQVPSVTQIGMFDHRFHLKEALTSARERILIIAPWVKSAVVNTEFMADLERRLRAGVTVHIGHGIGDSDEGSHEAALRRLMNLQRRFPENFKFLRLPNTHAKILIYDNTYITTSFNWLSFRGDPDRTYRMEEGTLVRSPRLATKTYNKYVEELERHGR
ncbi:hypothetical protein RCH16_003585 [Cryobacterium sp. MP_M5]|uniref:hypothetical protein n=1 Tax=unclassified Cryobacterium TaxID=2649013 RepID=UPI0018CAF898|nr:MULTISPECIES: hypothetical protein [unclassified Cryobacterium]MBG6060103.1 hypothetical protein [Cryobacterium sp. MP_M3]MEC5178546.1 hypothetical protein [Cryobacterium sp. MP_M5]